MRVSGRTFVVLFLASLPGLGLLLWAAFREHEQARAETIRATTTVAEMLAREQQRVFESAHLLLTVMSNLEEVVGTAPSCSATLTRMVVLDPRLVAIGVVDPAGNVRCTSFAEQRGHQLGSQSWFTRVMSSRAFAVGDYQIGQVTGRPLVVLGLPAFDGDSIRAVLYAALHVQTLINVTERVPLPPGATVTVYDRRGTLLGRHPAMPELIGKRVTETFRTGGSVERVGLDGVRRIFSFASLPAAPEAGVTIAVGVPTLSAYSGARNLLWQAALAAALALIVALAFGRRRAILDRDREAEGRAQRERFFESLIENAFDAVFIFDADGTFKYASPAVELTTGYQPEEFQGRKVFEFNAPTDTEGRERFRSLVEAPGAVLRTRYVHANGEVRHAEIISKNMLADPAIGGIVVNFRDITDRVVAEEELLRSRDELRTLAHRTESRIEQERRRIAREIHDDLGQSITSLNLDVGWLQNRLPNSDAPQVRERLRAMEEQLTATAQTVRDIAQELHAGFSESMSLREAIHIYIRQFGARSGMEVVTQLDDVEDDVPGDVSIALFRITQEATTNIARHAGATRVRVVLDRTDDGLQLEIHDNGRGLKHSPRENALGLGVLSMRERCLALGGTFDMGSSPDGGVKISVTVPL